MRQHEYFMKTAIHLANLAGRRGEVPIGSIIVRQNDFKIIGYGYNFTENMNCSQDEYRCHEEGHCCYLSGDGWRVLADKRSICSEAALNHNGQDDAARIACSG